MGACCRGVGSAAAALTPSKGSTLGLGRPMATTATIAGLRARAAALRIGAASRARQGEVGPAAV